MERRRYRATKTPLERFQIELLRQVDEHMNVLMSPTGTLPHRQEYVKLRSLVNAGHLTIWRRGTGNARNYFTFTDAGLAAAREAKSRPELDIEDALKRYGIGESMSDIAGTMFSLESVRAALVDSGVTIRDRAARAASSPNALRRHGRIAETIDKAQKLTGPPAERVLLYLHGEKRAMRTMDIRDVLYTSSYNMRLVLRRMERHGLLKGSKGERSTEKYYALTELGCKLAALLAANTPESEWDEKLAEVYRRTVTVPDVRP